MDQSITTRRKPTTFELVSDMNVAFGNPKGDPMNIDWARVRNQCKNIGDEYAELLEALGAPSSTVASFRSLNKKLFFEGRPNVEEVRDALCDIPVFSTGAQHIMGVDGDRDMQAVIDGVMTRFVKDEADLHATIALHRKKGVTETYTEGEYPRMILKSSVNQPDAPEGKFLKSASYKPTVFYPLPSYGEDEYGNDCLGEDQ